MSVLTGQRSNGLRPPLSGAGHGHNLKHTVVDATPLCELLTVNCSQQLKEFGFPLVGPVPVWLTGRWIGNIKRGNIALRHDCTEAVCGTDRVRILAGRENLSAPGDNEELTLEMMSAGADERLGCVARIHGAVVVEIVGNTNG